MSGLCGEGSKDLFTWRTAMKIIIFFTVLILISPVSIFGSEVDSIIKQQRENRENKEKQAENERNKYIMMQRCEDEIVRVVASKVKELMDKGVNFKKDPGVWSYKNIGGQRYASHADGRNERILNSMYDGRLLYLERGSNYIRIQPEGGTKVNIHIKFYKNNSWEVEMNGYFKGRHTVEFTSFYNVDEISTKRDEINKNLISAIEAAIKYGDK
jgi:hypothetical protein